MKILFVCLGNICRSPMAQGILQHLIDEQGLNWEVDSAGTNEYHTGEAPHRSSQKVCKEHNIDISKQRARRFVKEDFKRFDKIYVLAQDVWDEVNKLATTDTDMQQVDFLLNEIYPNENRNVTDPWYGSEEGYYPVFDEIEKACVQIVKK